MRAVVSFEGETVRESPNEWLINHPGVNVDYWIPKSAVTILDDPSKDPVGTMRKDGNVLRIKTTWPITPWIGINDANARADADVVGSLVVGSLTTDEEKAS